MENKDFAVFILTFGRPDKVFTIKTLRDQGYTGKIYLICSDDDKSINSYKEKYGEDVIIFSKNDYKGSFDIGDNFNDDRVVVYARNANFDIAKNLGYKYFLMLDDDYTDFRYKYDGELNFINMKKIKNLDVIFNFILNFYKTIPCLSIAFAQGGDYIGGKYSAGNISIKRKIMNSFFCSTDRPFKFIGRINEDVNTYVTLGNVGKLVFQTNQIALQQKITQSNSGGLTEFYLDGGTYIKSFYTVIYSPSNVKINTMGNKNKRLHHSISWKNTTPYIIDEKYKK
jgi:hypothetical protein